MLKMTRGYPILSAQYFHNGHKNKFFFAISLSVQYCRKHFNYKIKVINYKIKMSTNARRLHQL